VAANYLAPTRLLTVNITLHEPNVASCGGGGLSRVDLERTFPASNAHPTGAHHLAERIGFLLRTIRRQWQLSLREVAERSLSLAQERDDPSYRVSASWLDRLEREEHELTVNKLVALSAIYNVPAEQLLRAMYPGKSSNLRPQNRLGPNGTVLLREGPLADHARYLLPDAPLAPSLPDETTLLPAADEHITARYQRGIIGKRDLTLDPMIPTGSIVHIDSHKRTISSRRDWRNEFRRPIYFLMTRDGYVCGWCELDGTSDWLTVIPHPLSPVSSRRWKYRKEIEILGRVFAAAVRFSNDS